MKTPAMCRVAICVVCMVGWVFEVSAQETGAVTLSQDDTTFTMSNGTLSVKVSKESGDLVSMQYKGRETLTDRSGHPFVYWSHDVKGGEAIETKVTIDPADNAGDRAEVSVKGVSGGKFMGFGPGAPEEGDIAVDIDIRYSLARDDAAVYAYTIFEHKPDYPAGDFTEARLAAKLDPGFTHLHIDELRDGQYPLLPEWPDTPDGADKYIYTTTQFDHRAYGATNPDDGLGWWMLIPSPEFLSAGPTQPEFLVHGNLVVFCYWRSSHYGHAQIILEDGEPWKKVVGPIVMYANEGDSSAAMWDDAKARLKQEETAWPYDWVQGGDYAHATQRSTVRGRVVLRDTQLDLNGELPGRLTIGLTRTPYTVATTDGTREIDWQHDAKFYQHWVRSDQRDGTFAIPHVPAGTYNLHAFADGVLGELFHASVEVPQGSEVDLGELEWTPVRHGQTHWEIGKPDRDASEFAGADRFWHPGAALRYAESFPADTTFTIGESNPATDWFYAHTPFIDDPEARVRPFRGIAGDNKPSSRTINFNLDQSPTGQATLRIALTGTGGNPVLHLKVNGQDQAPIDFGRSDGALTRHQTRGDWRERAATFDASFLKKGANTLTLTVPAGDPNAGVIYDYLRLELAPQ